MSNILSRKSADSYSTSIRPGYLSSNLPISSIFTFTSTTTSTPLLIHTTDIFVVFPNGRYASYIAYTPLFRESASESFEIITTSFIFNRPNRKSTNTYPDLIHLGDFCSIFQYLSLSYETPTSPSLNLYT